MKKQYSRFSLYVVVGLTFASAAVSSAQETPLSSFDIPYERFTLDNGLTVIVSEDHSLPEVHIEVRYRVGSRDEKPGKTGFAHLFEHLMFNGSENYDGEHFTALRPYGARINGTTNPDRTNYFNIVPSDVVERVLFLESDRMGHLLGALTQEKLDEQRGVVQNEKRQGDNSPFGYMRYKVVEALFPPGHPYSWSTIGSMDDLNAASLADAKQWFGEFYGPANAFLILVGDIDVPTAKAMTEKYFGDIPAGKAVSRDNVWVPERTQNTLETIQDDKVKATRIVRYWLTPGENSPETMAIQSIVDALNDQSADGLYKILVEELQIADSAGASLNTMQLAGWMSIVMNLKAGIDPETASAALDQVIERFLQHGPTQESIDGGKTTFALGVARSIEPSNGRAFWLAEGETVAHDPAFYKKQFKWYDETTPGSVRAAASKWLTKGAHQINIVPFPTHTVSARGIDRSVLPEPSGSATFRAPEIEDTMLANGVKVRFIESRKSPLLTFNLSFDGGDVRMTAAERAAHDLYPAMIGTKTKSRSRDDIIREQKRLGLSINASANERSTSFTLTSLSANSGPGMALLADTILNARFDPVEFEQQHTNVVKSIHEAIFSKNVGAIYKEKIVYGPAHPYSSYGLPEAKAVTLTDVENIHQRWIRPENLTILAVGNASLAEIEALLNKNFGKWRVKNPALADFVAPLSENPNGGRVVLFDLPGAVQSVISVSQVVPGTAVIDADEYARKMSIKELGGYFGSRINANLREDKGWSYGISGRLTTSTEVRDWTISGSVQTDKTRESISEILAEIADYSGPNPISEGKVRELRSGELRQLATATIGTSGKLLAYLGFVHSTGFADDYILGLPDIYNSVDAEDVANAFSENFDMDSLTWIIVGDLEQIEAGVRSLNLGQVEVWNELGERVR